MKSKQKPLEALTLQFASSDRYQENMDRLLSYIDAYQDKDLIVAPEVCLTGFDYAHMATAAKFSAKALKTLKKTIDRQIVVTTFILEEAESFVNQAVVIHKHKIVHRQNKVKLFKLSGEDLYFKEGKKKRIQCFEIEGVTYAILICFELRFKELWKQIEGADVVLIPARWGKERKNHLEILSRALAVMNQCYVVLSNSVNGDMAGSSSIISPFGTYVADDRLESIEGTIDFREIKKMRRYITLE